MTGERETLCSILIGQEHCAHCHEYFDPEDLYPLSNRTPPYPVEFNPDLLYYSRRNPFYLFCKECIRIYNGSPHTNMVQTGMRRR